MSQAEELIQKVLKGPLFQGWTREEANQLLGLGSVRSFQSGELLQREGEEGESLLLLLQGKVELQVGERSLGKRGIGETMGEVVFLDPNVHSVSAKTLSKGRVWSLTWHSFHEACPSDHPLSIKLLNSLNLLLCRTIGETYQRCQDEVTNPSGGMLGRMWNKLTGFGKKR